MKEKTKGYHGIKQTRAMTPPKAGTVAGTLVNVVELILGLVHISLHINQNSRILEWKLQNSLLLSLVP